jgi:hypothetical protein
MREPVYQMTILYLDDDKHIKKERLYHTFVPRRGDIIVMEGVEYRVDNVVINFDKSGDIQLHLDYKFNNLGGHYG